MRRERLACGTTTLRGGRNPRPRRGPLGGELVVARGGLELLELKLELVEQPCPALGPPPVERPPELLDLEPEGGDHRLGAQGRGPRARRLVRHRVGPRRGGRGRVAQGLDVGRGFGHGRSLACPGRALGVILTTRPAPGGDQPAVTPQACLRHDAGLQV